MRRMITSLLLASALFVAGTTAASAQWTGSGTDSTMDYSVTASKPVPEPSAALAFAVGLGIAGVAIARRRR